MIYIEPVEVFAARHASGPQATCAPLRGVQHPLAPKIMAAMPGSAPVSMWRVINALAKSENPNHRARHRSWRLRFWGAVRELCRVGLLFRHRSWIARTDFALKPRPKAIQVPSPSARKVACEMVGSNEMTPTFERAHQRTQAVQNKLLRETWGTPAEPVKNEIAKPTAEQISAAASLLAQRPRPRKRKWTGFLNGERIRRNTLVRVPTGEVLPAYVVLRGKVLVVAPENSGYLIATMPLK